MTLRSLVGFSMHLRYAVLHSESLARSAVAWRGVWAPTERPHRALRPLRAHPPFRGAIDGDPSTRRGNWERFALWRLWERAKGSRLQIALEHFSAPDATPKFSVTTHAVDGEGGSSSQRRMLLRTRRHPPVGRLMVGRLKPGTLDLDVGTCPLDCR